jgi:hypothetical protein
MRTPEAVAPTGRKVSPTGYFLPLNLRRGGWLGGSGNPRLASLAA